MVFGTSKDSHLNNDLGSLTNQNELIEFEDISEISNSQTSILQTIGISRNLLIAFKSTLENSTKYQLAEEILNSIDEKLKTKILQNPYLNKVFVTSYVEIMKYMKKLNRRYNLEAFIWHDIEDPEWKENVISIKIELKDNKEKRKIWKEINSILDNIDTKGITFLTEVKRL